MVLGHHAPQLPLPVLTGVLDMTFDTILVFDNLINEIPRDQRMDIFILSSDTANRDWEYSWSLDIMNLNFPFLY